MLARIRNHSVRGTISLTIIFLLIEFYDEFAYGIGGAALPYLRNDLGLDYAQVGLLLGLPSIINIFIEPVIMLLGDTPLRRRLVVGGGLVMAFAMALIAGAWAFPLVLLAEVLSYPASGAFVTLSQATLMDLNPGREEKMMARWTVSGSLANLAAPLLLAGGFALALGWRWAYGLAGGLGLLLALWVWRQPFPRPTNIEEKSQLRAHIRPLLAGAWEMIRDWRLLRWIVLLDLSDLLLDMYTGYLALYFADVAGLTPVQTSLALGLFMLASLAADVALIPLLERFPGRRIVRAAAKCALVLYPAFLLVPWPSVKVALALAVRFSTIGWYPVLEGEAFAAANGRSGTLKAIGSLTGLAAGAFAWLVGWMAEQAGLQNAMWLLVIGPVALALFTPKPVIRDDTEAKVVE